MADTSFPVSPAAIALPILAIITLIIDIPPLVWHIRNRNLAASSLVMWVMLPNLFSFINPLIWPTDDTATWWSGVGLCDVEVKMYVALGFGFIGSLLCIMRNLAKVLDTERALLSESRAQRRRKILIDCLFCLGGPVYGMIAHYVVQYNRYYIFAIAGCNPSIMNSWVAIFLFSIWPPILSLVVVYHSVLVIIRMRRYRKDFASVLSASNSNMTKSRFLRLFMLSMVLIVIMLPTQFYVFYRNATGRMFNPYSWSHVHGEGWNSADLIPTAGAVQYDRWPQLAVGFALFPFFGLGEDAQKMYRNALLKLGFGRLFPCLHRERSPGQHPGSMSSGNSRLFGSPTRWSLYKKWSRSSLSSSSDRTRTPSVATSSPASQQRPFGHMSTINEGDQIDFNSPQAASHSIPEKPNPSASINNHKSSVGKFLAKPYLAIRHNSGLARPNPPPGPYGLGFFGPNTQSNSTYTHQPDMEKGSS